MNFPLDRDRPANIIPVDPGRFSRRRLLHMAGGCGAMSSTAVLSQLLDLQLTQSVVAQDSGIDDYKALVCVFLLGGIDSYNLVTPYEPDEYIAYSQIRTNLAIPHEELLPINAVSGRRLGLHPAMTGLKALYDAQKAAVVANVGSLVTPTTKANYGNTQLPLGLFSHSDLQKHWQSSKPQSRSITTGWGGRMADLLNSSANPGSSISMNIALGGLNIFQTGDAVIPYVVNDTGATVLNGYGANRNEDRLYTQMMDGLYPQADSANGQLYSDLLKRTLASTKRLSINAAQQFNDAISTPLTTQFPASQLGNRLKLVAHAIGGRQSLGHKRQVYFVTLGGWDHHGDLISNQATMLPMLDQGLKAFYDATVELGVQNNVTTFTASDFARTLSSNGSGSDHAWGGNQLVIGGAVDGGKTFGDYPLTLAAGNDLDLGRGRLIPTSPVDHYNAELAMWFGVNDGPDLETILPNIRRFPDASGTSGQLQFMQQGTSI